VSIFSSLLLAAGDRIICSFGPNTSAYSAYSDQRPSGDAMQLAGPVNGAMAEFCSPKCPRISLFRNATAANAMLIASGDQMKIAYKPEFFTRVYETYGDAGIQAILAHELGHAIDPVSSAAWIKKDWSPAFRAEAWTGCALAKLDLSARSLKNALDALSKNPPESHPDWNTRLQAMRVGYMQCGGDPTKMGS
jgi:hypothetical protein